MLESTKVPAMNHYKQQETMTTPKAQECTHPLFYTVHVKCDSINDTSPTEQQTTKSKAIVSMTHYNTGMPLHYHKTNNKLFLLFQHQWQHADLQQQPTTTTPEVQECNESTHTPRQMLRTITMNNRQ